MEDLIQSLSMISSLALAALLDGTFEALRRRGADTQLVGPRVWSMLGLEIIFVFVLFAFAWLALSRLRPHRWVYVLFLVVGASGAMYVPLQFSGIEPIAHLLSAPGNPLGAIFLRQGPASFLILQSIGVAMTGSIGVARRARPPREGAQ
jgi:hypothetical protein